MSTDPIRTLADLIKCRCCDSVVVQATHGSKKHYGCPNASQKMCTNTMSISSYRIETMILNDLEEKFLTSEKSKCSVSNMEMIESSVFYVAHSAIQTLALLEEETKSLNWVNERKR